VELKLPQQSYTIDTHTLIKEFYTEQELSLIMGSHNLSTLKKWKNYEIILRDYHIIVYPRPGFLNAELDKHPSVSITDTPQMEISSTFIRKSIQLNKNVQFFLTESVLDFIDSKSLHK